MCSCYQLGNLVLTADISYRLYLLPVVVLQPYQDKNIYVIFALTLLKEKKWMDLNVVIYSASSVGIRTLRLW